MSRAKERRESRDTTRPRSGMVTTGVSDYVGRLLEIALAQGERAPVERMLEVLVECEPAACAALALGGAFVLYRGGEPPLEGADDDGRLYPGLAEEIVAPLPGGTLHLAAPSLSRASLASYEQMVHHAAGVIALRLAQGKPQAETARLAHLQKLASFGQSAAGIVHELNNPLTAIVAYSDFLLKRLESQGIAETDVDRLRRIAEAATRIQQFCRELVDYSRPGGLHGPVDLHAILDRALGFCMHSLRSAEITVARTYRDIPLVPGVDGQLTQVFVNLFTNAWHAMSESGGTLSIVTRASGESVVVEVADEGLGIEEAALPYIFDSYFTTKPRGQGVGLGLSIVRQIVRDHGGSIGAQRRIPRGTVFHVELPVGM
jgi:signal transduction histidine kinase